MDEDITTSEENESIWATLDAANQDDDKYGEYEEDADAEVAQADKMERKLSAKVDNLEKKFASSLLRERKTKFEESASDLEKDLMSAVAADIRDPESFDKALALVKERAAKMSATEEEYKKRVEAEQQERAAKVWGMGPMGTPTPRTKDEEEEALERIKKGDTKALFAELMAGNWPTA